MTDEPSVPVLEARLAETEGHLRLIHDLMMQVTGSVKRRDKVIAGLVAAIDQRDAEIEQLTDQRDIAQKETERLRRVCRKAGVEWREVTG